MHTTTEAYSPVSTPSKTIPSSPFIEANTIGTSLQEISEEHIIPVFAKDNEPLISQSEFIEVTQHIVHHVFQLGTSNPNIRVSHPIKGRIPSAKGKPADQLEDHEKTLFFERMAFVIQVPSITRVINGSPLNLTVGGIKAYNQDNLYNRKGSAEHFKVFIGFVNKICTNLCIWTDGFSQDLQVHSMRELESHIYNLVSNFETEAFLNQLATFQNYELTEHQFAQLLGKARLYNYLPKNQSELYPHFQLNDSQVATVAKEYYKNEDFGRLAGGGINLWDLYNLFTGANKSSYIDTFADRSVGAFHFASQICNALEGKEDFWFLD